MRSYKRLEKKYTPKEIAEPFVFPGPSDAAAREQKLEIFQQYRKEVESKRSEKGGLGQKGNGR